MTTINFYTSLVNTAQTITNYYGTKKSYKRMNGQNHTRSGLKKAVYS
jgi:hypothetical protein